MSTLTTNPSVKLVVNEIFLATGVIGSNPNKLPTYCNTLRVAVENVGGGNTIEVNGRLAGQTSYTLIQTITGATTGTTVDLTTTNYDEIQFNCTVYSASGGAPKLIASSFFKSSSGGGGAAVWGAITGTITDQTDLVEYIEEKSYALDLTTYTYLGGL
jgi:hypothetical protein